MRRHGDTDLVFGRKTRWVRVGVEPKLRVDELPPRRVHVSTGAAREVDAATAARRRMLTWCDTNTVSGPTSAKKPICPTPHRMLVSSPPIVCA